MTGNPDKSAPLIERAFAVFALLYGSTAFIRLLMGADEYAAVGEDVLASPVKRILWPVTYLGAAYFLFKYDKLSLKILKKIPSLALLVAYIAVSVLWSETRTVSILSVAALAGNTLIGLYFGVRYGVREFVRSLGWVFGTIALATLIARMVLGNQALQVEGLWIGFFAQKNALGMNMSVGALVFFALARNENKRKLLYCCFCGLCAALVVLAQAMTCVVVLSLLASAMICWSFARRLRSNFSRTLFVTLVLGCSAIFVVSHLDGILAVLGKSPDLTGRLEVWGILAWMAQDRPMLGYGYGGFWVFGGPAQTVWETLGRDPNDAIHGHNGYLELIVECGIVGLGLLLWFLFTVFRRAWSYGITTRDIWPISLVLFLCFYNLGDTTFAARNNICWLILVAVTVQLVRASPLERSTTLSAKTSFPARPEISPATA
jgi:exopolysaccharide production protein ExoQ